MNYICTSFFHVDEVAPNIGAIEVSSKFDIYYKCIIVMFASAKTYADAKLQLFTDRYLPKVFQEQLEQLGVETVILKNNEYVSKFKNNFPGCLFLLDAFSHIVNDERYSNKDKFVFVDSDCIFRKNINFARNCVAYKINKVAKENINGQTRESLLNIKNSIYNSTDSIDFFDFYSGEFYLFSMKNLKEVCSQISKIVSHIQAIYGVDLIFTEEHLLAIVLTQLDVENQENDIRRIWTTRSYSNVDETNLDVAIYHMPAEKRELFNDLYHRFNEFHIRKDAEKIFALEVYNYVLNKPRPNFFIKLYRKFKMILKV